MPPPADPETFHPGKAATGHTGPDAQVMASRGGNKNGNRHGIYSLKAKLERGKIDRRSAVGQAMKRLRADFESDLGGRDNLSAQEHALLDRVVIKLLVLQSVEYWAMKQPRLIRRGGHLPPVLSRNYLSWSAELRRDLMAISLQRRVKDLPNLQDYLRALASQGTPHATEPEPYQGHGEGKIVGEQGSRELGSGGHAASQDKPVEEQGDEG